MKSKLIYISITLLLFGFLCFIVFRVLQNQEDYEKTLWFDVRTEGWNLDTAVIKDKQTGEVKIDPYISFNYVSRFVDEPQEVTEYFQHLKSLEEKAGSGVKIPDYTYYHFWHYMFFNRDLGVGKITDVCHGEWAENWNKYKSSDAFIGFGNTELGKNVVKGYDQFCGEMNTEDLDTTSLEGTFKCDILKHNPMFYSKCNLAKEISDGLLKRDINKISEVLKSDELIWGLDYWKSNLSFSFWYIINRFNRIDPNITQCVKISESPNYTNQQKDTQIMSCMQELINRGGSYKILHLYNNKSLFDGLQNNKIGKEGLKQSLVDFLNSKVLK